MSSAQVKRTKLIIFSDPTFPVEGTLPTQGALDSWKASEEIIVVGADELASALSTAEGEGCFVNLHAPHFPKSAWTAIAAFLHQGEV